MKKGQKAGFLPPISSIITLAKEKERRNRKREEEERRRIKLSNDCSLSFYVGYSFQKKKLLDVRDLFGGNFFKNPTIYLISLFAKSKTEIDNRPSPLACQSRRLFRLLIQEPEKASSLANYDHCQ